MEHSYSEYKSMSDKTLVELTLLGSGDAYSELVSRHHKAVLNTALSVTRNHYTAEDAAQDAFVTAWTKLNTLADRSCFKAWVCTIARNRARRLAERYREYVPLEEVENLIGEPDGSVEDGFETELLHDAVNRLSDKLKRVVTLFYFDGLSLAEIAARESISVAAVKTRLHNGRKQLRKDMGYMANEYETLPEAVERRLAEIKKWAYKTNRKGFKADYDSLLAELRALPESQSKYRALSDLMLCGLWWLDQSETGDEFIKELEENAYKSENKDVIKFIIRREGWELWGAERVKFIHKTLIPKFKKLGYTDAVGEEWFWLAQQLSYCSGRQAEVREALKKSLEYLPENGLFRAAALSALAGFEAVGESKYAYCSALGVRVEPDGGKLLASFLGFDHGDGHLQDYVAMPFTGFVDSILLDSGLKPGEQYNGSHNGDSITRASGTETVVAGGETYENCVKFTVRSRKFLTESTNWFKEGVGLVASERRDLHGVAGDDRCVTRVELCSCTVKGGNGLFPLAVGNVWSYSVVGTEKGESRNEICVVSEKDGGFNFRRTAYFIKPGDAGDWSSALDECRRGYLTYSDYFERSTVNDVSDSIAKLRSRAKTEWQKLVTEQISANLEDIMKGDNAITPDGGFNVGWARSGYADLFTDKGTVRYIERRLTSVWAPRDWTYSAWLADIFGIIMDRLGCVWNGGWSDDIRFEHDFFDNWMHGIDLKVSGAMHYAGGVCVKAGKFDDCLLVSTRVTGGIRNAGYRLHDADYYFAKGVGLVKVITHCGGFLGDVVYELSEYSGTGEGHFPIDAGQKRVYECVNSHEGYESKITYVFADNDEGKRCVIYNGVGKHARDAEKYDRK